MGTFTFTIPAATQTRISNSLDKVGYKFDASLGTTDAAQRLAFFKQYTIRLWQADVFNSERQAVINSGGNPATQAKNFVPLTDITVA